MISSCQTVSVADRVCTSANALALGNLALARRLDWRFLLPDPQLKRVYGYGVTGQHAEALAQFSESVELHARGASHLEYDVVVACGRTWEEINEAAKRVRCGGAIYAELTNHARWMPAVRQRKRGSVSPQNCRRALESSGFEQVSCYWHWPNFDDCTRIVPLNDPEPLALLLQQRASRLTNLFSSTLIRWAARCGLLQRNIPSFSIVGVRSHD